MRFIVSRVSGGSVKNQPCEGATRQGYLRIDARTIAPAALSGTSEWWYEKGKNHRVENGHIVRDIDETAWFVEFNSPEDLLISLRRYGQLLVRPHPWSHEVEIQIYDQ